MGPAKLRICSFIAVLLLQGCTRTTESHSHLVGEPDQRIVATDMRESLGPDGRKALEPSRLGAEALGLVGIDGLEGEGLEWLVAVLNQTRAPCRPCIEEGASIATCLVREEPRCENLEALRERGVIMTLEETPAEVIQSALQYEEPWEPVAGRLGLESPSLVLAIDYEDPFTRRYHPTWKALRETVDGLNLGLLHVPQERHPRSRTAALAVLAAGKQGQQWAYQDHLLEMNSDLSDLALLQLADRLGLDSEQWKADVLSEALEAELDTHLAMAEEFGVEGTPMVFINGYGVSGERTQDYLLERFMRYRPPLAP